MSRNSWTLTALALVLGTLYLAFFSDFTRRHPIQITVSHRPFAPNAGPGDILPIIFGLDADRSLTELSILGPISSNAPPQLLWQLRSKKGSQPVHGFLYGETIPGMDSTGPAARAPLQPNLTYRVDVRSHGDFGSIEFVPRPAVTE